MKRFLSIVALLPLLAGCLGESAAAPGDVGLPATDLLSDSGRVLVDVSADGPIALGYNDLLLHAEPAEGEQIESVSVVGAVALMTAHGHDAQPDAIELEGDAFRLRDLVLTMSGRWQITVDLDEDGASDTLRFSIEVP